jgi:hypothetical protein
MDKAIARLEEMCHPMGWTIDGITRDRKVYYRHIEENYELIVDVRKKEYELRLNHVIFTNKHITALRKELEFMEKLAKKTLRLLGEK